MTFYESVNIIITGLLCGLDYRIFVDTPAFTGGALFTDQALLVLCLPLPASPHTSLLLPH